MKVYCGKCKYFRFSWGAIGHPGFCQHPENITVLEIPSTYMEPAKKEEVKGNPKEINKENTCKKFEEMTMIKKGPQVLSKKQPWYKCIFST